MTEALDYTPVKFCASPTIAAIKLPVNLKYPGHYEPRRRSCQNHCRDPRHETRPLRITIASYLYQSTPTRTLTPEIHFPLQSLVHSPDRPPYPRFVNRFDCREMLLVVDGLCINPTKMAARLVARTACGMGNTQYTKLCGIML